MIEWIMKNKLEAVAIFQTFLIAFQGVIPKHRRQVDAILTYRFNEL